jgi:soluble lytic murein transglycosylase-like protein/tetratricopeptide (TPR) repeat protein
MDVAAAAGSHPEAKRSLAATLAAVSLLRVANSLRGDTAADSGEIRRLIESYWLMLKDEPASGMLQLPVLGGLRALEEALLEAVAMLAWSAGDRTTAGNVFIEYLSVASPVELDSTGTEIADHLVSHGLASEGSLALLRAKSFYNRRQYEHARRLLDRAVAEGPSEIRAEAGYYLARTRSIQGASRGEIIGLLTEALEEATDPGLVQRILFYRASVFDRTGPDRDIESFTSDLNRIIERFPAGRMADDALYELALHHDVEGDRSEALAHFARLRRHPGPNDWISSSHFKPALILYSRAGEGDIAAAVELLEYLVDTSPRSQLGLAARFWLGRIAEEHADTVSARLHFEGVIATCPYHYYAIRARLHLRMGPEAAIEIRADPETRAELLASYTSASREPTVDLPCKETAPVEGMSPSAFHAEVLEASRAMGRELPAKLQSEFTTEDLDKAGAFGTMGLLLALRQHVIGAASRRSGAEHRLDLALSVGRKAGDWPLAMLLVFGLDRTIETQSAVQHDSRYLAAAYPPVYIDRIQAAVDVHRVPPELLYAVMRRESLFCPAAVSRVGALGLFQFMPSTFGTLDSRWDLLGRSGLASMEVFLRDLDLSIALGARWFEEELLGPNGGDILLAVMEHNAGYPAVDAWRAEWDRKGRMGDIEFMIETARFTETRIFARSVLTDLVIAEAIGLFGAAEERPAE